MKIRALSVFATASCCLGLTNAIAAQVTPTAETEMLKDCPQPAGYVREILRGPQSGSGPIVERRYAAAVEWRPLYPTHFLCEEDTIRVLDPGAVAMITVYPNKQLEITKEDSEVLIHGAGGKSLPAKMIDVLFAGLLGPDDVPPTESIWRGDTGDQDYELYFATPGLDTGEARIASDGFDGKLSFAWYGQLEPVSIKIHESGNPANPLIVQQTQSLETRYIGESRTSLFLTVETGMLETGDYTVVIADELAEITGSFTVVEGRRPKAIGEPVEELPLNLQTVLDYMYIGQQYPEEWSFQGLQIFNKTHPDIPQERLLQNYLFSGLAENPDTQD